MTRETHPSIAQSGTRNGNGTERSDDGAISTRIPIQSARSVVRPSVADAVDAGATTDATCGEEINETDATTRR